MSGVSQLWGLPSLRDAAALRVGRWARRRQGSDGQLVRLGSSRIYILPTGVGLIFGLMTFAMLLGSMNYNNNLSFVLTFLLAGLGFVSMQQCQRNLAGLVIAYAGAEPVFARERAGFRVAVTNRSKSPRRQIQLYAGNVSSETRDLAPGESRVFTIFLPAKKRGRLRLLRYGVRSRYPFELFRAWSWLHMDLACLVYPAPAEVVPPPPATQGTQGQRYQDSRGQEDFSGFRRFIAGDSPRHVAWKAYARSGELLSKQFAGSDSSSYDFDFREISGNTERRLAVLARWVLDAENAGRHYGLRIPGNTIAAGHGAAQRHRCLEALALFDARSTGRG